MLMRFSYLQMPRGTHNPLVLQGWLCEMSKWCYLGTNDAQQRPQLKQKPVHFRWLLMWLLLETGNMFVFSPTV